MNASAVEILYGTGIHIPASFIKTNGSCIPCKHMQRHRRTSGGSALLLRALHQPACNTVSPMRWIHIERHNISGILWLYMRNAETNKLLMLLCDHNARLLILGKAPHHATREPKLRRKAYIVELNQRIEISLAIPSQHVVVHAPIVSGCIWIAETAPIST